MQEDGHNQVAMNIARTILFFKTTKCFKEECSDKEMGVGFNCAFYHSERDRRRFPFNIDTKHLDKYNFLIRKLNEDPTFRISNLFEMLKNIVKNDLNMEFGLSYSQLLNETKEENCINGVEFNYHPMNFKKWECHESNECDNKFCYCYHSEEEREEFEKVRDQFGDADGLIKKLKECSLRISKNINDIADRSSKISNEIEIEAQELADTQVIAEEPVVKRGKTSEAVRFQQAVQEKIRKTKTKVEEEINSSLEDMHFETRKRDKSEDDLLLSKLDYHKTLDFLNYLKSKKIKIIKKGKHICRYNVNKSNQFVYDKKVEMFENIKYEFKHFTKLNLQVCLNNICGFLNSYGGTLYFGISDSGIVKGTYLNSKDIEDFQLSLDISLKKFYPAVYPEQIRVSYHEVCYDDYAKYVIVSKYILQIDVFCMNNSDYYVNNENYFNIKKHGSLNNLSKGEVIEFIKARYNPVLEEDELNKDTVKTVLDSMSKEELERTKTNLIEMLKIVNEKL